MKEETKVGDSLVRLVIYVKEKLTKGQTKLRFRFTYASLELFQQRHQHRTKDILYVVLMPLRCIIFLSENLK